MTDNNDLFDPARSNDSDGLVSQDGTPVIDPNTDYLESLVGEGKKFKDVQALAKSVVFKDAHIAKVENENAELRQKAKQGMSLEEFYEKVRADADKLDNAGQSPSSPSTPTPTGEEEKDKGLSVEQIRSLLAEEMAQKEATTLAEANVSRVQKVAEETLGPGYKTILSARARELNMDTEVAAKMAATSPDAFIALMVQGATAPRPTPNIPHSEVSTHPSHGGPVTKKTLSYYQKIERENPQLAKTDAFRIEKHNSAMAMGEEFFDT